MIIKKFYVILLVFIITFSFTSLAGETWKITSLNWQPYSGAELTNQGNSIQKLQEILRLGGIRLIVEFYPWKRAQLQAKSKEYVGYFPAWPEEVQEGFFASPAIDMSYIGVLKKKDTSVTFKNVEELFKNYRIGLVQTYVYPSDIENAAKKYPKNKDATPNEISLLKKLSFGRFDAAITDPDVMFFLAEKEGIYNIEKIKTLTQKELVIAFRKGDDNDRRMKTLKKLIKDYYK